MQLFTNQGQDMSTPRDVGEQAIKGALPVTATALAWLASVPLDRWLLVCTITYTVLQIFVLVRDRIYKPWKQGNAADNEQD